MEYFPRKIEKKLERWFEKGYVILIKGARQTGKTTLLKHFQERYGGTYISLEFEDLAEALVKDPLTFGKRFVEKKYLYIDEAQYVKNIGKYIKILHDFYKDKLKIIITGSGSFEIKENLGKYLVGRAVYFELFPLSFEEFLLWKDKELHKIFKEYFNELQNFLFKERAFKKFISFEKEFLNYWQEFIIYGGFPAIVKEKDNEAKIFLLKNLLQTYLEKDIFFFLGVRDLEKFRSFLKVLSYMSGYLLELNSLIKEIKLDYKTAMNYLNLLIHTYIIDLLSPYHKNLITELKKIKKIYFLDTGLRNAILNNFSLFDNRTDRGELLETFVFSELKKLGLEIKFWRTAGKAEIDFIIFSEKGLIPVEAKLTPEIKKGFLSFLKTYHPEKALMISLNLEEIELKKINNTKLLIFPCFYF